MPETEILGNEDEERDENENTTESEKIDKTQIEKKSDHDNRETKEKEKEENNGVDALHSEKVGNVEKFDEKGKGKNKKLIKEKDTASSKNQAILPKGSKRISSNSKGIEKVDDILIGTIVYAKPDGNDAWFEAEVEKEIADSNSRSKKKTKASQLRFLGGKGLRQNIPFNRIASKSCVGVADVEIGSRIVAGRPSDTVNSTVLKKCKSLSRADIIDVMYAGVVAELACEGNFYRYLVFFDDGYAQYFHLEKLFLVIRPSFPVWTDVSEHCRRFIKEYLEDYPSRPFLQAEINSIIRTEWDGEWWESQVIGYDASLVKVHYESDSHTEWVYRGATRLEPIQKYFFNSVALPKKKKRKKKKEEETEDEESNEVRVDDRVTDPQFGICKYSLQDPNGVQQRVEWNVPSPSLELIARQTTDGKESNSAMDDDEIYSVMSQRDVFSVLDALQSES